MKKRVYKKEVVEITTRTISDNRIDVWFKNQNTIESLEYADKITTAFENKEKQN